MLLRDIGNGPGDGRTREPAQRLAIQTDHTAKGRQKPEQRLEQRRLTAAVGPEQTENLAGLQC